MVGLSELAGVPAAVVDEDFPASSIATDGVDRDASASAAVGAGGGIATGPLPAPISIAPAVASAQTAPAGAGPSLRLATTRITWKEPVAV